MITFTTGNIFESDSEALVNTVNLEGYMGKGIAYQFKSKFPLNNEAYVKACKTNEIRIGKLFKIKEQGRVIINFPTKDKWRKPSKLDYIKKGLADLLKIIKNEKIKSISIPSLGSGNGGLNWNEVKKLITTHLTSISKTVDIKIYEPSNHFSTTTSKSPKINFSHIVLMLIKKSLKHFSKFRLQKAAFFLNFYLGEEYFKFNKYKHVPYAHTLDILSGEINELQEYSNISQIDNLLTYTETILISDNFKKKMEHFQYPIKKSTNLINDFDNLDKLELICFILYLFKENQVMSIDDIEKKINSWLNQKRQKPMIIDLEKCIDYLEKNHFIRSDMFGNFELLNKYKIFNSNKNNATPKKHLPSWG